MEYSLDQEKRGYFRHIDWITILLYLLMVVAGVFSIYAASYDLEGGGSIMDFDQFSGKQVVWIGLALIIGVVILLIDAKVYDIYAYPIYGVVMFLLLVTIFIAPDIKGSRSWISFGSMSIQPAEFGKFATALALAKLFDGYNFTLNAKPSNYLKAFFVILLPVMLIMAQKETGTALAYFSLILVLYREGMSGLVLFAMFLLVTIFVISLKFTDPLLMGLTMGEVIVFIILALVVCLLLLIYCKKPMTSLYVFLIFIFSGVLLAVLNHFNISFSGTFYVISSFFIALAFASFFILRDQMKKFLVTVIFAVLGIAYMYSVGYVFSNVLQSHQKERIEETLGITDDITGSGYNVNQSKIAIGSGGLYGKGFLNGTQTKLKYVPEQHTDFIFCTIGEEQGFLGTTGIMLLFLCLILRIIYLAERQPTNFGRVYGYCVACFLILHVAINIGMVLGLCPVIGIPLPFFSYGGSSLWGFTILLFILLAIDASRKQIK